MTVRKSALAGQWYPADAQLLKESIVSYLSQADSVPQDNLRAIIVPHAGHVWSGSTAAAGFKAVHSEAYDRLFILCPNHRMPVRGAAVPSADAFETPLGRVRVDQTLLAQWKENQIVHFNDEAHRREHAIEIQLPFIQVIFGDRASSIDIVPIVVGEMSASDVHILADALRKTVSARDLLIISTDFIHYGENYGFVPFGSPVQENIAAYDARTVEAIQSFDREAFESYAQANPHCACGLNALRVLEAMLTPDRSALSLVKLAYDTSGRKSGDASMSVSYEALGIMGHLTHTPLSPVQPKISSSQPLDADAQRAAHDIVRRALSEAVSFQHETPVPQDIHDNPVFSKSYGVFVTLNTINGDLRGCIGNIIPTGELGDGLWGRAQDAALNDPRFDPVQPDELPSLSIEISVLTPLRTVSGPQDIIIGKHGTVLRCHGRSAVFLPQVAPEQGWDVPTMLMHLSMKAGLKPDAWKSSDAAFAVFEAQVF